MEHIREECMKNGLVMPVLAAVLCTAACGGDGPTASGPSARVRFFNATTGMTGSGAFTANGQFVSGSALAFGQATQSCPTVAAGSTSFGFGAASTGGTGLSGNALGMLNDQRITDGGSFTMVVTGSATSPQLYLLDNSFPGTLASNQAAVRFVNLAPGPNPIPNVFVVFANGLPPQGSLIASNVFVGTPTAFRTVTSGANAIMAMVGHDLSTRTDATLNLQAGTVNTIAIVSRPSGGFQFINIPRC
jgi:hypothetical protein